MQIIAEALLISDWYSEQGNQNEFIKISVRFLTNEIRSDALDIKIFLKQMCREHGINCTINQNNEELVAKLKSNILKKQPDMKKKQLTKIKKKTLIVDQSL